jgi:hypothetical protein
MTGEDMARRAPTAQRDLFASPETTNSWPLEVKREMLAIVETLLLEARTEKAVAGEAGHEQNHA